MGSNGNETGSGFTTSTDNEQTASPGYTYTYDNAGEMTSETQTSTGDVWTYGYDFRGRMVTAVEKTSGGSTLESVTYTYDALDNRIGMDENGTQTWTLYDGGTPIMDFNGSGSLTMRYLWSPTGIVARQTSGGTVSWYLADALGTVRDLINNSGAIIDHVDFSAFGTVLGETSPTTGDRFTGFAMLERDTVTGLNLAVFAKRTQGRGGGIARIRWGYLQVISKRIAIAGTIQWAARIRKDSSRSRTKKSRTPICSRRGSNTLRTITKKSRRTPSYSSNFRKLSLRLEDGLKMGNITFGELKGVAEQPLVRKSRSDKTPKAMSRRQRFAWHTKDTTCAVTIGRRTTTTRKAKRL